MQVMCIQGHKGLLQEGDIYTVVGVTRNGNYLLQEVDVPEGYTSFSKNRFSVLDEGDLTWSNDFEEAFWDENPYWVEQPTEEYTT